ncbi:MAG TPA: aldose 1-epimerase family protein [Candidatus Limiplasma sp.]|nr:aldose 1-epimerase family protein [Candidatus Limiplasma sp.]
MLQTIANDVMSVSINELGAELWSIRGETEYLWQGNPAVWAGRSPTIFPYVARLFDGKYTVNGEPYRLPIHGFAGHLYFTAVEKSREAVTLEIQDSKLTRALYPWPFTFQVRYALEGRKLLISYLVSNTGSQTMVFGLGGHPGFNVPLEDGLAFTDYELRFCALGMPELVEISDDCFITGKAAPYPLANGDTLRLRHDLFDRDAIVLKGMADTVTLRSDKGRRGVRVSYPQMPYLGLWHMPKTEAPYVCIEPWSSLPAKQGETTEFIGHPDLISLPAGERYQNDWSVEILE